MESAITPQQIGNLEQKLMNYTRNVIEEAPLLGHSFAQIRNPEAYRTIRAIESLSIKYAHWLFPKIGISPAIANNRVFREIAYGALDTFASLVAPVLDELEEIYNTKGKIEEKDLDNLANKYGIQVFPASYWITFLKAVFPAQTTIVYGGYSPRPPVTTT